VVAVRVQWEQECSSEITACWYSETERDAVLPAGGVQLGLLRQGKDTGWGVGE
jgi:hypothetical protein